MCHPSWTGNVKIWWLRHHVKSKYPLATMHKCEAHPSLPLVMMVDMLILDGVFQGIRQPRLTWSWSEKRPGTVRAVPGYMVVVNDVPPTWKGWQFPVSDYREGSSISAILAVVVETGSRGVSVARWWRGLVCRGGPMTWSLSSGIATGNTSGTVV